MKPVKLVIEGLQSFKEQQTLNFDMYENSLFVITGPTGSGKSTIIDAIILALYGKIPRNDEGEKSQNAKLLDNLNKNHDKIYVKFDFYLNEDYYEITRCYTFKQERKVQFDMKKPIMSKNSNIIANSTKQIEFELNNILGLSYSDFTKSVILVQNRFSDFLKLNGIEKRKMLAQIFDLTNYGQKLNDKVNFEINEIKNELKFLNLDNQNLVSIEQINKKESELEESQSNIKSLKKLIETQKNEFEFQTIQIKYLNDINILESKIENINFNEITSKLKTHEIYFAFINEYNLIKDNKKLIVNNNVSIEKLTSENITNIENLEVLKNKKNKLNLEISKLNDDVLKLKFDPKKLDELSNKYQDTLNFKVKKSLEENLIDLNKNFIEQKKKLEKSNNDLNIKKRSLINLDLKKVSNFEQIIYDYNNNINTNIILNEKIIQSNKQLSIIEKQYNDLNKEYTLALKKQIQSIYFEIANKLCEDEECPVCGSQKHPKLAKQINTNDVNLENLANELNKLENKRYHFIENTKKLESEIINVDKQDFIETENKLKVILDKNIEIELKNDEINKFNHELEYLQREAKLFIDRFNEDEYCTKIKALSTELELLSHISFFSEQEIYDIKTELDYQKKTYVIYNDFIKQIEVLKNDEISLNYEINNLENVINNLNFKINELNKTINKLDSENHSYIKSIEKSCNVALFDENILTNDLLIKFKKQIREYEQLNLEIETLNKLVTKDFKSCSNLSNEIESNNVTLEHLEKTNMELYSELSILNKMFLKQEDNFLKISKLNKSLVIFEKLHSVVKANNFVTYLANNKLKVIVENASRLLYKISNCRYEIKIYNKIEFEIIDNLNGSKARKTTTLSGGESFIVSLCLALSLSKSLQLKKNCSLEFFFLDEGFGTLDKNCLELVMENLIEIQQLENISLGIITHIDQVKQIISSKIIVSPPKDESTGTTIKHSIT